MGGIDHTRAIVWTRFRATYKYEKSQKIVGFCQQKLGFVVKWLQQELKPELIGVIETKSNVSQIKYGLW